MNNRQSELYVLTERLRTRELNRITLSPLDGRRCLRMLDLSYDGDGRLEIADSLCLLVNLSSGRAIVGVI